MRQSILLSGLGSKSFNSAIKNIQDIHQIFGWTFAAECLEPWIQNDFEGSQTIDAANRYFTPRLQATQKTQDQIIPFSRLVDQNSILTAAMGRDGTFTHTIDNEVDYYELVINNEGPIR